jgi:hypothetical protein
MIHPPNRPSTHDLSHNPPISSNNARDHAENPLHSPHQPKENAMRVYYDRDCDINLIKDNLILLGVDGAWQRAAIGLMLLIGVCSQAISDKRRLKQAVTVVEEKS